MFIGGYVANWVSLWLSMRLRDHNNTLIFQTSKEISDTINNKVESGTENSFEAARIYDEAYIKIYV